MKQLAKIALLLALLCSNTNAGFTGPTPYLEFDDSPFAEISFSYFFLEDFEDGSFNTPGVSSSPGIVRGPTATTDSVDADDGLIDGFGTGGWDYYSSATGDTGLTFTFDAVALGQLPTHAGLVWTDGGLVSPTLFEAFDENGNSLGTIGPVTIGDNSFAGETAEDHFFGAVNAGGISAIRIRDPGSIYRIGVDHLQYGAIPEPSSIAMIGLVSGCGVFIRRRFLI